MSPPSAKPPLSSLLSTHDFLSSSLQSLPPKPLAFLTSAATDSQTHRSNTSTYSLLLLRPLTLIPVHQPISLSSSILSRPVSSPLYASPTSLGKLFHPRGELEIASACHALQIAQVISTSASCALSAVCSTPTAHPKFFSLYMDRARSNSAKLLDSLGSLGVTAVWLTVDAPVMGKRESDERVPVSPSDDTAAPMAGTSASPSRIGALGRMMGSYVDAGTSWDDVAWIRQHAGKGVKVVLKGIQTASDALRAARAGADGIVISNHGGRSLDTSTATILVLLELQKCCPEVFDRMEVMIDGGIMRGTDVFKALCLGARAVGVGRGVLYGLNYGREGVEQYFSSKFYLFIYLFFIFSLCLNLMEKEIYVLQKNVLMERYSSKRGTDNNHEDVWRHQPRRPTPRIRQHPRRRSLDPREGERPASIRKMES